MKATGIVRRIDDLGRVVIPKEIRRTMRIREGDPLEIYTDREGEVIFKKYSPIGELGTIATQYAETLRHGRIKGQPLRQRYAFNILRFQAGAKPLRRSQGIYGNDIGMIEPRSDFELPLQYGGLRRIIAAGKFEQYVAPVLPGLVGISVRFVVQ